METEGELEAEKCNPGDCKGLGARVLSQLGF